MPGRTFTREFKAGIVRQLASGAKRPAHVCREYNLATGASPLSSVSKVSPAH